MRTPKTGDRMLGGYDVPNVTYSASYRWVDISSFEPSVNAMVKNQSFLWRKQQLFDQFVQHADQVSCTRFLRDENEF